MRQKDVTNVTNRQIQNVQNAAGKMREGIGAVAISPGQKAADNIDVMVQNFLAAANDGRLETALRGVNLEEWKKAALDGVSRVGPGMERKRAAIEEFHRQLQEYQLRYSREIDAMPSGTLGASRDRMLANFDAMAKFKYRKGQG